MNMHATLHIRSFEKINHQSCNKTANNKIISALNLVVSWFFIQELLLLNAFKQLKMFTQLWKWLYVHAWRYKCMRKRERRLIWNALYGEITSFLHKCHFQNQGNYEHLHWNNMENKCTRTKNVHIRIRLCTHTYKHWKFIRSIRLRDSCLLPNLKLWADFNTISEWAMDEIIQFC